MRLLLPSAYRSKQCLAGFTQSAFFHACSSRFSASAPHRYSRVSSSNLRERPDYHHSPAPNSMLSEDAPRARARRCLCTFLTYSVSRWYVCFATCSLNMPSLRFPCAASLCRRSLDNHCWQRNVFHCILFVGILFSRRFRRQRCITLSFAEDSNGVGLTSPRIFSTGLQ